MRWFRVAWVVLAIVIIGLDAAGIPYAYAGPESVCTRGAEACFEDDLVTPEGARELEGLGLSLSSYAAYLVGVETAFTLVCLAVALVIFLRRSDERMALFASFVLLIFGGAGAAGTMRALADAHPAFWFPVNLLDYVSEVCFVTFFLLFPDGRFVPRWTRILAAASAIYFVFDIFFPDSSLALVAEPLFFVFVGVLAVTQVYRYRRVSTPEQRQQTKWVVFGIAVALVGFSAVVIAANVFVPVASGAGPLAIMAFSTVVYGFLALIPVSIGVAILRSRLYDIDLIINRALVYGALTATLALVYFGGVAASQYAFRALTGQVQQPQLAIVASTLAIAALFNPLRRRIQDLIDRRFYRHKYDAAKTLEAFNATLRDETDLGPLETELLKVVGETVHPAHVSLWLRSPEMEGRNAR